MEKYITIELVGISFPIYLGMTISIITVWFSSSECAGECLATRESMERLGVAAFC